MSSEASGAGWRSYLPGWQSSASSSSAQSESTEEDFALMGDSDPGSFVQISSVEYSQLLERNVQLLGEKNDILARLVGLESNMKLQQETLQDQLKDSKANETQKNELLEKIQTLTKKVEMQVAQNLETLEKMQGITDTNSVLEKTVTQLQDTAQANETEISKNKEQIKKLAKENLEFARQIQELIQFNKELEAEIVKLKNNIQEKDDQITDLESKIFTLKSDVTGLTKALRSSQQTLQDEQQNHALTKANLHRTQQDLATTQAELATTQTELVTAKTESQELKDALNKLQEVANLSSWKVRFGKAAKMPTMSREFAATIQQHHIALGKKALKWVKKNIYMKEEETKKKTKEAHYLEKKKYKDIAFLEKKEKMLETKMPDGDDKTKELREIATQIDDTNELFDGLIQKKDEQIDKNLEEIEVYKTLTPRNNANTTQPNVTQVRRPSAGKQEVEMGGMEAFEYEETAVDDEIGPEEFERNAPPKKKWWDFLGCENNHPD